MDRTRKITIRWVWHKVSRKTWIIAQ